MGRRNASAVFQRRLAALLAILFVLGATLSTVHDTTTRHATCELHGELIDLPLASTTHPEGCDDHDDGPRVRVGDPGERGEGHDHCGFVAVAKDPSPALDGWSVFLCKRETRGRASARVAPRAQAVPLYLLAPKQSPPRA